jgi:hypothetical protein
MIVYESDLLDRRSLENTMFSTTNTVNFEGLNFLGGRSLSLAERWRFAWSVRWLVGQLAGWLIGWLIAIHNPRAYFAPGERCLSGMYFK